MLMNIITFHKNFFGPIIFGIGAFFDPSWAKKRLFLGLNWPKIYFIKKDNIKVALKHAFLFWLSIKWIEPFYLGHVQIFSFFYVFEPKQAYFDFLMIKEIILCQWYPKEPENDAFMSWEPQFLGHLKVIYRSSSFSIDLKFLTHTNKSCYKS